MTGTGPVTVNGGTILTTLRGVDVNGGTNDVTVGADVNPSGGRSVEVTNRTGGTVDLNGAITEDATGINLTSNTGATIRFDGGLVATTGANVALNATGGGTLAVTDPAGAAVNTLSATEATALNVVNTSIHNDDLTFQSIASGNSTGAFDPVSGIILTNTVATGGALVVAGNGSACTSVASCTGGAIQGTTGPGIHLTGVPGGVSLTRVAVANAGDDGVRAATVGTTGGSGLALATSFVSGNGNAVNEHGLDLDNVLGTSSITSSTVTGSAEFNARFDNDNGTGLLTVTNSTFSANSASVGADGLLLTTDATAIVRSLVQGNTFSGNRDDGFQLLANGDSTVDLFFNTNTVDAAGNAGAVPAHAGVTLTSNSTSEVEVLYNGGTIVGADGSALIVNPIGSGSTFDATIQALTIGTPGVAGSGSASGAGMRVVPAQKTDAEIVIRNNAIHGTAQQAIYLRHNDGAGTSDFTVTNNLIRNVAMGNEPIFVQSGGLSTDTTNVCADIGGFGGDNGAPGNDFVGQSSGGVTDIAFNRRTVSPGARLRLPGFDGDPANLTAYVQSRNVGNPTVMNYGQNLETSPGPCQQPTSPSLP